MAQAARLNLRMQKELKLLMTDPPPGVSFPFLCDGNSPSSSSLSSIEARIEGPEGTVYSKGVFTIKVQIPERYPFQPPNVTFITPIYHPNIDNGGRICLDILNLPPKGAWQPSLNISTVLTSIGLLLSEPNPDDGLMAETSREYKYNRQAFDQTARLWTEKYANAGENGKSDGSSLPNIDLQPEIEVKTEETSSKDAVIGAEGSRKKLRLNGEKLSLKSKALANINRSDKENEAPIRKLSISHNQKPHLVDSSNSVVPKHVMTLCEESSFHGNDKDLDGNGDGNGKQVEGSPKNIESIIVSDSEESDEGEEPMRSRLFRMRKITGKLHGVNQTL